MTASVTDLLNTIRSSAYSSTENRGLLSVADTLEALFASQEHNLDSTHNLLVKTQQELCKDREELRILQLQYQALEDWRRIMAAQRFGKSSERWTKDEESQACLFNEIEVALPPPEVVEDEHAETPKPRKKKTDGTKPQRGGRAPLPAHLPREIVRLELSEAERTCASCGTLMVIIGEESSEQLEIKPAEFFVRIIIRPVSACSCGCGGTKTAPVLPQVYPKSIMGDSLVTQVVVSKFCDALPFYRQERILQRAGIEISRQTMARSAQALATWLEPLNELIQKRLAACEVLCADETRLRVLQENGIKKESSSYMWVAAGRDEHGEMVRFHYGGGRSSLVAKELLGSFSGILMCDGYGGYPKAVEDLPITLAACMAHVRRKFHDVLKGDAKNARATEAMSHIKGLYLVEREAEFLTISERTQYRGIHAQPLFEAFRKWLHTQAAELAPTSALGKAVSYAINHVPRLEVYLGNGAVPIDNNRAENAIRPFVVGRKNWLFSAEAEGAVTSATLYSIIETAKANLVEPMHYLRFLLACHQKFGKAAMPWDQLFPRPELRSYAETIGVTWELK